MIASLGELRVLDAAQGVAAPFAAQLLRWSGAGVTKLAGDNWLHRLDDGPASLGRCLLDYVDTGKTAVDADGTVGASVAALAGDVDVLVTDWTPRQWRVHDLDLRMLTDRHPALVIVSVTGYGLDGPHANRVSAELTTYHAGGEGFLLPGGDIFRAFPDRPPVRGGRFLADFDTGLAAATATLAACVRRAATGAGDLVEVSAQEVELGNNRTTLGRAFYEAVDFDRGYSGYDYAGVLRCVDGWICLRPSEERHWQQFCRVIGRDDLAADARFATRMARFENNDALNQVLGEWTATRTQGDVRAALLRAGCPGGSYLDARGVLGDAAIGSRGLITDHAAGGRAPSGIMHVTAVSGGGRAPILDRLRGARSPGPLAGLRVLDLTWVAAGPYTTELLAFLGAEVLKIESTVVPDLFRRSLADPKGDLDGNIRFVDLNQGKKSVALNLKSNAGRDVLLGLAGECDVLVENYRPGVRDRLGIGDPELHRRNPELVVVALSGFGATATDADRPGYASIFSAESGLSAMTGYPDSPPADIRDSSDLRTGTAGALAVLVGLLAIAGGDRLVSIDVSARDTLIALQGDSVLQASRGGDPTRSANQLDCCAPYDCYRAFDGWVAIAVRTPDEWSALAGVLDEPRFDDDALIDARTRVERRAEIDKILGEWCSGRRAADVVRALATVDVPVAASAPASSVSTDPHLASRAFLQTVDHPVLGPVLLTGSPFRFHASGTLEGRRPPLLGEHTRDVLTRLLGLTAERFDALDAAGTFV